MPPLTKGIISLSEAWLGLDAAAAAAASVAAASCAFAVTVASVADVFAPTAEFLPARFPVVRDADDPVPAFAAASAVPCPDAPTTFAAASGISGRASDCPCSEPPRAVQVEGL